MNHPTCEPDRNSCHRYGSGHHVHHIQARFVGRSPWGWRDGLVAALDGGWLSVDYLEGDVCVRVWHHDRLDPGVAVGDPVRVHERLSVLGGPFGWLSVLVEGGMGPVPEPTAPELWVDQMSSAVTDLGTGRSLPTDHDR